jgi:hypothetical protein
MNLFVLLKKFDKSNLYILKAAKFDLSKKSSFTINGNLQLFKRSFPILYTKSFIQLFTSERTSAIIFSSSAFIKLYQLAQRFHIAFYHSTVVMAFDTDLSNKGEICHPKEPYFVKCKYRLLPKHFRNFFYL